MTALLSVVIDCFLKNLCAYGSRMIFPKAKLIVTTASFVSIKSNNNVSKILETEFDRAIARKLFTSDKSPDLHSIAL